MTARLALLAFLLCSLAACGADGPPEPVEEGVRIDAAASVGVTARF